jgi:hypothetical protein
MKRLIIVPLALALVGCPGDKQQALVDTIARDTTPIDLSQLPSNIPEAAPDTFTPPKLPTAQPAGGERIPDAPAELMAAVEREQTFTRFCYQEFGLKSDPSLQGGVAVVVTVTRQGITSARVGADSWSSAAGKNVNRCLNERAKDAWEITPGSVRPGTYRVPLTFRGA